MKLYHGTSNANWLKIQKSKCLGIDDKPLFLSIIEQYAESYGEVLLEVEYEPLYIEKEFPSNMNSNIYGQFQIKTFNKISLKYVKEIKRMKYEDIVKAREELKLLDNGDFSGMSIISCPINIWRKEK